MATLAYQLLQSDALTDLIGPMILASIGNDPAIFEKRLEEQVEVLILKPLRGAQGKCDLSKTPEIILIDGSTNGRWTNPSAL